MGRFRLVFIILGIVLLVLGVTAFVTYRQHLASELEAYTPTEKKYDWRRDFGEVEPYTSIEATDWRKIVGEGEYEPREGGNDWRKRFEGEYTLIRMPLSSLIHWLFPA